MSLSNYRRWRGKRAQIWSEIIFLYVYLVPAYDYIDSRYLHWYPCKMPIMVDGRCLHRHRYIERDIGDVEENGFVCVSLFVCIPDINIAMEMSMSLRRYRRQQGRRFFRDNNVFDVDSYTSMSGIDRCWYVSISDIDLEGSSMARGTIPFDRQPIPISIAASTWMWGWLYRQWPESCCK